MKKSMTVTKASEMTGPDIRIFGDPDSWQLIVKPGSDSQEWMRSTKAMEVPGGCLVNVSTQVGNSVAEAVCFVPGVSIHLLSDDDGNIIGRKLGVSD
jgi:hypothetical protein